MSKEFYRKGKWPINTNHGWKIWAATKATEDLFAACLDVTVKIGDVVIDQNFFVQDEVSHFVILGQPFITTSGMEKKVLDSGAAFAQIRSQNRGKSVQVLTLPENYEKEQERALVPNNNGFLMRIVSEWGSDSPKSHDTPHMKKISRSKTSTNRSGWGIYVYGRNRRNEERIPIGINNKRR